MSISYTRLRLLAMSLEGQVFVDAITPYEKSKHINVDIYAKLKETMINDNASFIAVIDNDLRQELDTAIRFSIRYYKRRNPVLSKVLEAYINEDRYQTYTKRLDRNQKIDRFVDLSRLHFFWIIPLFPFLLVWFLVTEIFLNTIYHIHRVISEYIKTLTDDFSLAALIIAIIMAPITLTLAIFMKLFVAIFRTLSNTVKRSVLLFNRSFAGNLVFIFLWEPPKYISFPK